jgi:hypothetical protein
MTHYAVDTSRNALVAVWDTGDGELASTVADFPESDWNSTGACLRLAASLTFLSEVVWRCYTHPVSAAGSVEPNSEGWHRELNRGAFAEVVPVLIKPNLPDDRGSMIVSYNPVEESAHRVGRALHALGNGDLTSRVAGDVRAELAAVEDAELGELTGRACQAVVLSREDASPVQVAAANHLLHDTPLAASGDLFTTVDPTAAAVAAAHWLYAAASVTAELAGCAVAGVVLAADDIEALPVETPTRVLELLEAGQSPREAVTGLVREAMAVAEGRVPDVGALSAKIASVDELVDAHAAEDPGLRAELMKIRITSLDPARPARDLVEDLLARANPVGSR